MCQDVQLSANGLAFRASLQLVNLPRMTIVDDWGDVFTNGDIEYPQACKSSDTYVQKLLKSQTQLTKNPHSESTLQSTSVNEYLLRGFLQPGLSSACPEASAPSCMSGGVTECVCVCVGGGWDGWDA